MTTLMRQVYWAFGAQSYPRYEDFIEAVSRYNDDIAPGKHAWDPVWVFREAAEIRVVYRAPWKNEDDILDVSVSADESGRITMGRLLHAIHEASLAFFADADHRYFEGLRLVEGTTFALSIGS